jgi:hypothetical protein
MLKWKRWLCVNNNDLNTQTTKKVGFWHLKIFCLSCIHAYGDQKWPSNSWEGNCTTSIKLGIIEVWKKQKIVEDWINLMLSTIIYKFKYIYIYIVDDHDISKEDVEGIRILNAFQRWWNCKISAQMCYGLKHFCYFKIVIFGICLMQLDWH